MAEIVIGSRKLFRLTGTATGVQAWSSTRVYGGGVTTNAQGQVSGGGVSSTVSQNTRFFLRTAEGREEEATIVNGCGVRDGQNISLVYAGPQNAKLFWPIYFFNHNTNHHYVWQDTVNNLTGLDSGFDWFLAFVVTGLVGWFSFDPAFKLIGLWCLAAGPVAGIFFYQIMLALPKRTAGKRLVEKAVEIVRTGV